MQTLFYDIMEDDRSILLIIKICFTAFQLGFAREKNMLETRENLKILNSLVRETHLKRKRKKSCANWSTKSV